ncbi:MAG: translocation/assembly module TamB domain-containing protein [Oceanicaulis sp.]
MSAEEQTPARKKRRLIARPLAWLSGIATFVILLAVGAVLLVTGPLGRELVRDYVDGREVAGYGTLDLGRIDGALFSDFQIDRLAIETGEGPWLIAEDVTVEWDWLALLDRRIQIEAIGAERIEILRRPEREPQESGGGSFDWELALDNISIGTVYLAEGVAGPEAEYAVDAAVSNAGGGWSGRLQATRLDAAGDEIDLDFVYRDTIEIDGTLEAAPGGPLAELLRAPDRGATVRVDASGDLQSGSGEAGIVIGGQAAVNARVDWSAERLTASGRVRPAIWPEFERLQTLLGGPADFQLSLPLDGAINTADLDSFTLELGAPEADLTISPAGERRYRVSGRAGAGLVATATDGQVAASSVQVEDGLVDLSGESWRFSGDVAASDLDLPGEYRFGRVSGPLSVAGPTENLTIEGDLQTEGVRHDNQTIANLLGSAPGIDAAVRYDQDAQRLRIDRAALNGAAGPISLSGLVDIGAERFDIEAASPSFRADTLTDQLAGRGAVDVTASGAFDGAVDFTAEISGFQPAGALAERLSGPIEARVTGSRTADGALFFERVQAQSPDLAVDATGAIEGETYTLQGEAAYSGESPVGGVSLAGTLEAAFEATYSPGGLDARIDAQAGRVSAGPVQVDGARLRVRTSGPLDDLSGEARLTGESPRGPVDLSADFARRGETLSLTGLEGQAGGLTVEGDAEVGPETITADLNVAPSEGFGALEVSVTVANGEVDVQASATDLIAGDLSYFDQFDLTLTGPLEDARFTLDAAGAYGARFEIDAEGRVQLAGGPLEATAMLTGEYGPVDFASLEPITITGDPLSANALLSVGEGRARVSFEGGETTRLYAELDTVPAAVLSLRRAREPVEGTLSGVLDLVREGGVWTGQGEITGQGLQPGLADYDRPIEGRVALDLTTEALTLDVSANGPELTATAQGRIVTGPVSSPADLTDETNPIEASARVDGRIGSLAAFHLGAGQALTGRADVFADVSGTVGDPDLSGRARLSDASFSDSATGLDLRELTMAATFTQSRAEITELSAVDGEGGRLTGGGTIEFAGGLSVDAEADFTDFRVVDRDDVSAVATGNVDFTFSDGEGLVSGRAEIDRAEVSPPDAGRPAIPSIEVTEVNVPAGVRPPDDDPTGAAVIALEYQVDAPRRIFVRGANFDTEWGAELAIGGTIDDPEVYGVVRAVRGRADLLGRVFDIESGVVRLQGDPREASLDLTAVREERDITARIVVDGTVTDPSISLASTPSLPPDEVASRILFGEGAANLSGLQAAQLAASLASLSGSGGGFDPLGALRQASGLDQLGVRQDAEGDTVVAGGRYISEDVYLELESGTSSAAPATTIEWELTRRFTLLSRVDADGEASVAVSWRTEYDDNPFGEDGLFDFDRLDIFGLNFGGGERDEEPADGEADAAPPAEEDRPAQVLQRLGG